jgi:nucleoside 2-deoxyribosyltransferase
VADLRGLSPRDAGLKIGALNEELIRGCDGVVANMTPFRGPSADVGTAYEMGYAAGLGRVVCAYTNVATPFTRRTVTFLGGNVIPSGDDTGLRDADGMALEDFGLADNLMLESSITRTGGCLVVHPAPPGRAFTALEGFERCLAFLRSGPLSGS